MYKDFHNSIFNIRFYTKPPTHYAKMGKIMKWQMCTERFQKIING